MTRDYVYTLFEKLYSILKCYNNTRGLFNKDNFVHYSAKNVILQKMNKKINFN